MLTTVFIAGTDTHVGKTYIAAGLIRALQKNKFSALGLKPIASGCEQTPKGLRNADAVLLQEVSSLALDYACINPMAFLPAIAPHIAASQEKQILSVAHLAELCQPALSAPVDFCVVEGAGGWLVPLNLQETMADFVITMNWPVILVVGMRLGCINHALLTLNTMQAQGARVLGWVANFVDPSMLAANENLATLTALLNTPLLGVIQHGGSAPFSLNLDKILSYLSGMV